jgi:UDPglucose 6-dehydrogenase
MKIGVVGRGHVGTNVIAQFGKGNEIVSYDRAQDSEYPFDEFAECALVMACVDTPAGPNGAVDVSNVESAVAQLPATNTVFCSTIPPGTTTRLARGTNSPICFWPEYVGETSFVGSSWERFSGTSSFAIIGGEPDARRAVVDLIVPLLGPEVRVFQCRAEEAELVKYMENSYLAAKVTFVNEFRELSDSLDLDWNTVREGWLLDPRIERDHTAVFEGARGYAGKCLPEDVAGILCFAETRGVDLTMLAAAQDSNRRFQAMNTGESRVESGGYNNGRDHAVSYRSAPDAANAST